MKTIQLSIPKPCHEDWNTMSPQEKGRFCDKCCKTVLDFSNKSSTEIQEFIFEHEKEKICGRFRNNQLNKPIQINIPIQSVVNQLSFSQAFLLSLLIVFGTSLISCTTHSNETIGKLNLIDTIIPETKEPDSVIKVIQGEVSKVPTIIIDPVDPIEQKNKSHIKEVKPSTDTTINLPTVNIFDYAIPLLSSSYSTGLVAIREVNPESKKTSTVQDLDSIQKIEMVENTNQLNETFLVYPNPAHDVVKVKFYSSQEEMVGVELYDMDGKLILTVLSSQQMSEGENDFQFDVSNLPPATYLLRLMKNDRVETKRIVIL